MAQSNDYDNETLKSSLSNQFGTDLWINLRLRITEVIAYLESIQKKQQANGSRELIDDWCSFIRFLDRECSGKNFQNDKQWSELMNLMEINKKLNHRTVKFNDILKNRHLIEANAASIRRLNESAKLGQTIKVSLDELDSLVEESRLELPIIKQKTTATQGIRGSTLAGSDTSERQQQQRPYLLNELSVALSHLLDKCQPLIYIVRLGIKDDQLMTGQQSEFWRERLEKREQFVKKNVAFLSTLRDLQTKLANLKPLMSVSSDNEKDTQLSGKFHSRTGEQMRKTSGDSRPQGLNEGVALNSIATCKRRFRVALGFADKLVDSLYDLCAKQRESKVPQSSKSNKSTSIKLPLTRLLNAKGEFINNLYDVDLVNALEDLKNCHLELDKIMQTLRMEFGRFYFVNDLELLTIIALDFRLVYDTADDIVTRADKQNLLSKLFNNSISGFVINDQQHIIGVRSPFNEVILFINEEPVAIKKKVNMYSVEIVRILNETMRKLRRSLKSMLIKSINSRSQEEIDWLLPVQLMNLSERIKFCQKVEHEINNKSSQFIEKLMSFYENQFKKLSRIASAVVNSDIYADAHDNQDHNWLQQFKESAVISLTVYFISTLNRMQSNKVNAISDWHWQKQIRYYLISNDNTEDKVTNYEVEVRITDTKFLYKFDYLPLEANEMSSSCPDVGGQAQKPQQLSRPTYKRLISTQTTERCFLVASQSVCNFRLGAQPYGPAGSGKTESIKALGHLLGCQVIVHNCDISNDSDSLDKLIWGLAHTGLWGCFDEFNRLSSSVLSSVSATLELVQTSIRENRTTVELTGTGQLMCIDRDSAFFVTLNPGDGIKYRGRRRLPANLRSLFLPISMVRTEIDSIVSESLLTFGAEMSLNVNFEASESLKLGNKLYNWIEWMKLQNVGFPQSKEASLDGGGTRCEWDLRLVMAILRRLKMLAIRNSSDLSSNKSSSPSIENLLLESIECEVVPRLTDNERQVFFEGIEKNFDQVKAPKKLLSKSTNDDDDDSLSNRIRRAIVAKGLRLDRDGGHSEQLATCLSNQLETRTGVLLLGAPGAGKSTTWRVLQAAEGDSSVRWLALNHKSCEKHLLFGFVEPITRKWIDGLFTMKVREAQSILQQTEPSINQVWLILDGPIDPDWIESLNSVLDDNKVLTLSSGERLDFSLAQNKSIKLIFETADIKFASPATTSRLGLVYHEHRAFELRQVNTKDLNILTEQQEQYHCSGVAINNTQTLALNHNVNFRANNQQWQVESNLAIKFLAPEQTAIKLLIISGKTTTLSTKLSFFKALIDPANNGLVFEYNCSQLSNSSHLTDLILANKNQQATLFILNNAHLIRSEDQWEVKSFIELLRFLLTYNGLYTADYFDLSSMNLTSIKAKFVLTVDSIDQMDLRILQLANVIRLESSKRQTTGDDDEIFDGVDIELVGANVKFREFLNTKLLQESLASPIVTLSCSIYGSGRRQTIMECFKYWKTFTFRNSKLSLQSVDCLERLLDKSLASQKLKQANLFILSDFECNLLKQNLKSKLYHLLNKLKAQSSTRAASSRLFIYLAHNTHRKGRDFTFWRSMGPVYHFEALTSKLALSALKENLRTKLGSDELLPNDSAFGGRNQQRQVSVDWLISGVEKFISSSSNQSTAFWADQRRINSYLNSLTSLLSKLRSNLLSQRRTLSSGLNRLNEFELSLEKVKARCRDDEEKLRIKKLEIEQLMRNIEMALQGERKQMEEIKELKRKQEIKTKEIDAKSKKVQLELAKVLPLVESSKSEISQYLKPEAMNEIKTLRSPPKTIKDILDVLFILLKIDDLSWNSIKSHLAKYSFKDELTGYDFNKNLNEALLAKVEAQIASKCESFEPKQAARASKAVVPILGWIQATVEYGRVLVKLDPLNAEMNKLRVESETIQVTAQKLEDQHQQIAQTIGKDSSRLAQLQKEFDDSQRVADEIKFKLNKSQKARDEFGDQVNRWRLRLNSIESLLKGKEIEKLSLATASVALFYSNGTSGELSHHESQTLKGWLKLFGFSSSEPSNKTTTTTIEEEFVVNVLNLMKIDCDETAETTAVAGNSDESPLKPNELSKALHLLILKSLFQVKSATANNAGQNQSGYLVPFIDLNSPTQQNQLTENELKKYLSFRGILCQDSKDISFIRLSGDELNEHSLQSIELASRLNNLIVLGLRRWQPDSYHVDLDIIELCQVKSLSSVSIILMGQLDEHPAIKHLVRPIRLLASASSESTSSSSGSTSEEVRLLIMNCLIQFYDPKLNETFSQLERELKLKQDEMKRLEVNLLKRLATIEVATKNDSYNNNNDGLKEDLVKVISDLNKLSDSLASDVDQLRTKMSELQVRQAEYSELSSKAADFYSEFLANLGQVDKFYHVPLETYTKWLIVSRSSESATNTSDGRINYSYICERVMLPMRPEFRLEFQKRLEDSSKAVFLFGDRNNNISAQQQFDYNTRADASVESQLERVILDFIEDDDDDCGEPYGSARTSASPKLMVVLHDACKSSPQVEIDELFRDLALGRRHRRRHLHHPSSQQDSTSPSFEAPQYSKTYATEESSGRLELALARLLSSASGDTDSNSTETANGVVDKSSWVSKRCLCVANAHLSSRWINSHLLQLLHSSTGTSTSGNTKVQQQQRPSRAACILVGESTSNSCSSDGFDLSVLNFAQVKFWHDELALSITSRFDLFARSIQQQLNVNSQQQGQFGITVSRSSWPLTGHSLLLSEQLVLLHVVCQELAKSSGGKAARIGWSQSYSFDHDQLCLALKTLRKLCETDERQADCNNQFTFDSSKNDSGTSRSGGSQRLANNDDDEGSARERRLRRMFCHYLENIVYGARLETLEDELTLARLIERFVGSAKSAKLELAKFEQFKKAAAAPGGSKRTAKEGVVGSGSSSLDRLLAEFIGLQSGGAKSWKEVG